jgi:hypothetical protein
VISEQAGLNYADLALAYLKLGLTNEARATIQEGLRQTAVGSRGQYASVESMLSALAGEFAKAKRRSGSRKNEGRFGHFHHTAYNIGCAYASCTNRNRPLNGAKCRGTQGSLAIPPSGTTRLSQHPKRSGVPEVSRRTKGAIDGLHKFRRQLVAKSRR